MTAKKAATKRVRRLRPPDAQSGRVFDSAEVGRGSVTRVRARTLSQAEAELVALQGILVTMEQQRDAAQQQLARVVNADQLLTRFLALLDQLDEGQGRLKKSVQLLARLQGVFKE